MPAINRRLVSLVVLVTIPCAWMLCASLIWSGGTGRPYAPFAWWEATQWWRANWWVNLWITLGAAVPTIFLILFLAGSVQFWRLNGRVQRRLITRRGTISTRQLPRQRAVSDNHGHSDWRPMDQVKKRFPGPEHPHGGIAVGEAYRVDLDTVASIEFEPKDPATWGMGGKAALLIDPCTKGARAPHSGEFASTGSGKSAALATKIITWTGSSVVVDPTIELGPLLDKVLRKQRKRVFHIGIPNPKKPIKMTGVNVLRWIDTSHPEVNSHIRSVVSWIYDEHAAAEAMEAHGHSADDPFFGKMGRTLVRCLLAHVIWSNPDDVEITLTAFAAGISTPERDMVALLHKIHANSPSKVARRLAGSLMEARAAETFSGVYLNAIAGCEWLFDPVYSDLLSVGDFDPDYLLLGRTTVFLNIDTRTLEVAPVIPRVLVGALLNTIFMAEGHVHSLIAFFIDETSLLGRLKALKTARDLGRHGGIVIYTLWQSLSQLRDIWGVEQTRAWIDAFSWMAFASIRAAGSGKDLQEILGGHGVLAYSEGSNQGQQQPFGLSFGTFSRGQNANIHEIHRALITAAEMQQDLRTDDQIIVTDTGMPIRCGRCLWYRRPEIQALIEG
jgi:type IV secretion system protein VirD4